MVRVLLGVVMIGLVAATGCGGGAEVVQPAPYALSERALYAAADRLVAPAPDSAQAARRSRYAAQRMREAGLMPAFGSSFLDTFERTGSRPADPARAHVLGYVPGRNPSHADRLVILAADLNTPGGAAALETARRLALEALDTQVPERTVLVALWAPPRTGDVGLAGFLAHPTWALEGIEHVLLVVADSSAARQGQALLAARGIGAEVAEAPRLFTKEKAGQENDERSRTTLVAFAESLYTRTRSLTFAPDSLAADSLSDSAKRR